MELEYSTEILSPQRQQIVIDDPDSSKHLCLIKIAIITIIVIKRINVN
jgi:hypothetical protein